MISDDQWRMVAGYTNQVVNREQDQVVFAYGIITRRGPDIIIQLQGGDLLDLEPVDNTLPVEGPDAS